MLGMMKLFLNFNLYKITHGRYVGIISSLNSINFNIYSFSTGYES